MPDKDFDYLFPHAKTNPIEFRGYVWKVIVDPTRNDDDPGMFFGRLFRMIDIRLNRDEKSTWPEGIVFVHVTSGCCLPYQGGLLVQIGIQHEVRRVIAISNISKNLKNGDVFCQPITQYIEESSATQPRLEKLGNLI